MLVSNTLIINRFLSTNAPNVYDAFYVFESQNNIAGNSSIQLVKKYPQDLDDGASIEAIKKFCFPKPDTKWFEVSLSFVNMSHVYREPSDPVAFFTFTLTDGQGFFTFGHCRFSPSKKTCTCFVSALPDISFFKYTLGYLANAEVGLYILFSLYYVLSAFRQTKSSSVYNIFITHQSPKASN